MGLRDTLKQASDALRKLRRSQGPDSYSQYKREREQARKQEEAMHDHEKEAADLELEKAERERGYADRYAREREGDIAREQTQRPDERES